MEYNDLLTQFINDNYAEKLRRRGFYVYKKNNFNWCKIVDGNIIQSIHFVRLYGGMELVLYGFYPMYQTIYFPLSLNAGDIVGQIFNGMDNYDNVTDSKPSYWYNPIVNNYNWIVNKIEKIFDLVIFPRFERITDAKTCNEEMFKTLKELKGYPCDLVGVAKRFEFSCLYELIRQNKKDDYMRIYNEILVPNRERIQRAFQDKQLQPKLKLFNTTMESIEKDDMSIIEKLVHEYEESNKRKLLKKIIIEQ